MLSEGWVVTAETGSQNVRYLLSGPQQKKFIHPLLWRIRNGGSFVGVFFVVFFFCLLFAFFSRGDQRLFVDASWGWKRKSLLGICCCVAGYPKFNDLKKNKQNKHSVSQFLWVRNLGVSSGWFWLQVSVMPARTAVVKAWCGCRLLTRRPRFRISLRGPLRRAAWMSVRHDSWPSPNARDPRARKTPGCLFWPFLGSHIWFFAVFYLLHRQTSTH